MGPCSALAGRGRCKAPSADGSALEHKGGAISSLPFPPAVQSPAGKLAMVHGRSAIGSHASAAKRNSGIAGATRRLLLMVWKSVVLAAAAAAALLTPAPASAQGAHNFCPLGSSPIYNVVNGVQIWRFDPATGVDARVPELNAAIPNNLNGLMVDPVRNRLLLISRPATTPSSPATLYAYDDANGGCMLPLRRSAAWTFRARP